MPTTPKTRRRWFSYSLRSLFVLTIVACLPLVWVAYERQQSRRELQIVEQLKASDERTQIRFIGRFDRSYDASGEFLWDPTWWRRALSAVCGPRVDAVLVERQSSLSDISPLAELKSLGMLGLDETQVSDLSPIRGLTSLFALYLNNTAVSDLTPLAALTYLERLDLEGTPVSDLSPLVGLKRLDSINLNNTQVRDLTPLARLPSLECLCLDNTPVNDLSPLAGLANLSPLSFSGTQVSDLAPLSGLVNVWQISCEDTPVSDLSPLANLANLGELFLDRTQVSDLAPLAGLKTLRKIYIQGTPASEEQVKQLQKALPNCQRSFRTSAPRLPLLPHRSRSSSADAVETGPVRQVHEFAPRSSRALKCLIIPGRHAWRAGVQPPAGWPSAAAPPGANRLALTIVKR